MTFLMGSLCFPIQFDLTNFEKLLSVAKGNTSAVGRSFFYKKISFKKASAGYPKEVSYVFLFLVVSNIIPVGKLQQQALICIWDTDL